ncbi:MAG: GatB/YqeY domain-containing protein [Patescibacteria group bacterium]|jgi:uncharacterized protein YqeY|nr:GatB/YqeY domain-containing protein [Patescibacteria group bacterium]
MSLKEKIIADFKQAFKDKDLEKKSVLSMLRAEISNKEIELKVREDGLSDEETISLIKKASKQRKDAATQYKEGGREELAEKELAEAVVLEEYLPEQMSDEEINIEVKKIIEELGVSDKSEMGKVMGIAMGKLKGKADGGKVKEAVERILQ